MKKIVATLLLSRLRKLLKLYKKYNDKLINIKGKYEHSSDSKSYKTDYKNRTDGFSYYFQVLDKMFSIVKKMNKIYLLHNSILGVNTYKKFSDQITFKIEKMTNSIDKSYNKPLLSLSDIWVSYRQLYEEATEELYDNQTDKDYIEHVQRIMDIIENNIVKREIDIADLIQHTNSLLNVVT